MARLPGDDGIYWLLFVTYYLWRLRLSETITAVLGWWLFNLDAVARMVLQTSLQLQSCLGIEYKAVLASVSLANFTFKKVGGSLKKLHSATTILKYLVHRFR